MSLVTIGKSVIAVVLAALASCCPGTACGELEPAQGLRSDGGDGAADAADAGSRDATPSPTTWKAVLMAGDWRIPAFDNARRAVAALVQQDGVLESNTIHLSRDRRELIEGVRRTSIANFEAAMRELGAVEGDGCFVFMTSHGTQAGFLIRGQGYLTPPKLGQILDDACGELPTVALISACYSGVFIEPLSAPNRIVLTASRGDRASFGCTSEATYTDWDECLITHWHAADTWEGLHEKIQPCIVQKEKAGGYTPSLPQGFFGDALRGLRILNR
jgi:hypothetical protein